jgi:hypothetical protein
MKYRFIILLVLGIHIIVFTPYVFSQTSQTFDLANPTFNPLDLINPSTGLPAGVEEQISIEQIPKIPKPNETVSIRITSYLTDLNKAKITWSQDGTVLTSQIGAVTNQVQAPESGKTSVLTITIVKENGGVFTKTITLSPADVDLIYEAQTYAHPFFKGKKLFTSESVVLFVAVPNFVINGRQIPAENLVYTWKINGSVQQQFSGYGKNTFALQGSLIERPTQVEVEVSAINSSLIASQNTVIKSTQPEILIYENNPLLGVIYEQAILGGFLLERNQVDFEAIPYFFSANTKDDINLVYKWSINNTRVATKAPQENYLLLQNNANEEGRAFVSVVVNQTQKLLQTTSSSLELNFKKIKEASNETNTF